MKKQYIIPSTVCVEVQVKTALLTASGLRTTLDDDPEDIISEDADMLSRRNRNIWDDNDSEEDDDSEGY